MINNWFIFLPQKKQNKKKTDFLNFCSDDKTFNSFR